MNWLKRFAGDFAGAHIDGLRAMRALPLLFTAIILWEFAQHIVEVRIGMFESEEAMKAVSNDPTRMAFGWVKMILIYVGAFFVIRHLAGTRDGRSLQPIPAAFTRYLPYMIYMLGCFALVFYARGFIPESDVMAFRTTISLSQVFVEPFLMVWVVAAATDGAVRSPLASARRMGWLYLFALPLFFFARLPINLAHQQLNQLAMGESGAMLWGLLALDSVVVGLIVAIIPAISVRVARLVSERREQSERSHVYAPAIVN